MTKVANATEKARTTDRGEKKSQKRNENRSAASYVLYTTLTGDAKHNSPSWNLLAKKYGFNIVRDRSTLATVQASPDIVASLQRDHPEIKATKEKKYHLA
jgi:hypothetical protein